MNYDKSPGPNDLNPTFYNFFWHMCGEGIFQKTTTWLETRTFPSQFNNTSMKDFRPISLCNALYKITSKFLTNRLKPILPKCISHEHTTFVEDRSILDNAFLAFEIIHHMKCKQREEVGAVALKIFV